MKKILLALLSFALTASMAAGFSACSNEKNDDSSTQNSTSSSQTSDSSENSSENSSESSSESSSEDSSSSSVPEMVLTLETSVDEVSLREGESVTVSATTKADGEDVNATLTWESEDTEIATVSRGVITAQNMGTTTIIVSTTYKGKEAKKTIQVEVKENFKLAIVAEDEQVKGDTQTLDVTLTASSGEIEVEGEVQYSVDDTEIATVENNVLTGAKKGYVTVSASYVYEDFEYKATKTIRIREFYDIEYIVDGVVVETQEVLDGETFECIVDDPTSADGLQTFDKWLYNGEAYEFGTTAVEEDMQIVASFMHSDLRAGDTYANGGVYGARVTSDVTTSEAVVNNGDLLYTAVEMNKYHSVYLPRVNYSAYASVTFTFTTDGWTGIGYNGMNIAQDGATGTITITNNSNDTYSVLMKQNVSAETTHTYTGTISLASEADIVTGKDGLALVAYTYATDRNITISLPTFVKDFSTLKEGGNYTSDVYGSYVLNTVTNEVLTIKPDENGWLDYELPGNDQTYNIYLPRINYNEYSKVVFNWKGGDWMVSSLVGQSDHGVSGGTASYGTITITNNGDGTLTVVMTDVVLGKEYTCTVSDMDIINGVKVGIAVSAKMGAPYRHVRISVPTFEVFAE